MKTDNLTYSFLALRDKLHRSAVGFLKDDEDAKDALQDTFLNLWRNGGVDSAPEARNKLFAVLRNVCIDRLRKPRSLPIDSHESDTIPAPSEEFEDIGRYEALLTKGLTDMQRRIYSLVTHDGLEYDEIAARLEMTVEAVRMNMSRARKRIRDNLKQIENERTR